MNWKTATIVFCLAVTAAAIGYDVLVYREAGVSATISRVARAAAMNYPIIPFAVGVLIGHLFWSQGQ